MTAIEDIFTPEKLFEKEEPCQLMGEGQLGEGPEQICLGFHGGRESVGAADDEDRLAVELSKLGSELLAGELASLLREDHNVGTALLFQLLEQGGALLFHRAVGKLLHLKLCVGACPLGVFIATSLHEVVFELPDDQHFEEMRHS